MKQRSKVSRSIICLLAYSDSSVEYVQRFATKEAADAAADGEDEDADEEMSDIGSISEDEEQIADD